MPQLIVVLDQACIELVHIGHGKHHLLEGRSHARILAQNQDKRDPSNLRPDIVHHCLVTLLDSDLNKKGLLKIYIRTVAGLLITVDPRLRPPVTYHEFESIFATLLITRKIKATTTKGIDLVKIIKNDLAAVLPDNCHKIAFEVTGHIIDDLSVVVRHQPDVEERDWVLFIGAIANGNLVKSEIDYQEFCISPHPLSAAYCCALACKAFESNWIIDHPATGDRSRFHPKNEAALAESDLKSAELANS